MRLKRFTFLDRLFHLGLMVSFMLQAATGLGRMYIETAWGNGLARLFGGYQGCLVVHREVGLIMIALMVLHLVHLLVRARTGSLVRGPDSLLPRFSDIGQFLKHLGWMVGACKEPEFERWAYWEKFDYWAVFWGTVIIGTTGLMLYDPVLTSRYVHGWALNVAFWVHRIEALLAIGHVFIIHFAIAHLRPRSFPMDTAMFQGSMSLAKAKDEKAAWVVRLERQDQLQEMTVDHYGIGMRIVSLLFGYAVVAAGVTMVVYALANFGRITW